MQTIVKSAVIRSGNKQYIVKSGDVIDVELLPNLVAEEVIFTEVLLITSETGVSVGSPTLAGVSVKGELLSHGRGEKLFVFKYKKRKNCRRRRGHRQSFSRVKVISIEGWKDGP